MNFERDRLRETDERVVAVEGILKALIRVQGLEKSRYGVLCYITLFGRRLLIQFSRRERE
jgi:hypothetical protein